MQTATPNPGPPQTARTEIVWRPNRGPQSKLIYCPCDEIFYGGARGGGKTDGMLGKHAVKAQRYGKGVIGVFFRRTREDLKEAIERSQDIYGPIGAKYSKQEKQWRFPNGARLKFEYLDRDEDANNYQGHNYTDLYFEEIQHWPNPKPINKIRATLRSAQGIPCQFHATGNPGGPGHQWVKSRYIDPAPDGWKVMWEDFKNPFNGETLRKNRIYIPSKLLDNPHLGGGYVATLQQAGSAELVRAWLEGDWDIVEGAFFDCWSHAKHVLRATELPSHWLRFRSMDWGSASPFSVHWWAVASEDWQHPDGMIIPRGAMVAYREWYGIVSDVMGEFKPNIGVKLTAEEVAKGIHAREALERERHYKIDYAVLDPSAFAQDGGPSIAERMMMTRDDNGKSLGIMFRHADNKRVGQRGMMGGWDQMRARLKGDGDGRPMLYFFNTCIHAIRTIPVLQHDPDRPEDVDTDAEDHAADDTRYACMSRPWMRPKPVETDDAIDTRMPTLNEIMARKEQRHRDNYRRI